MNRAAVTIRRTSSSGFTLLEMMLAIGILSVVLAMIAGLFHAVVRSKVHGEDRLSLDREGRAILWQISNELRGAVQTPIAQSKVLFLGIAQTRDLAAVDSLTVSTLDAGHRRAITGFGAEQVVAYTEQANPSHRGWFFLTRSQTSALLTGGAPNAMVPIVVANNLVSLHLRYFDGNTWDESWDYTAVPLGQQLPVAVSIDLALGADNGRVMNFSTQVLLPMAVAVW